MIVYIHIQTYTFKIFLVGVSPLISSISHSVCATSKLYYLFTQNVQMAFGAGPLIQSTTRSSTTRSWPTVGQTAVYLS